MDAKEFVEKMEKESKNFINLYEAYMFGDILITVWKVEDYYSIAAITEFYTLRDDEWIQIDPDDIVGLEVIV